MHTLYRLLTLTLTCLLSTAPAWSAGTIAPGGGPVGGLPAVGNEGDCLLTTSGAWASGACPGAGSGAPTTSQYWTGAADATLSAEKNLGVLGTGLVINTAGVPSIYAGVTCTNQVLRILSAAGAGTCNTITSAFVDASIAITGSTLAQFTATTSAQLAGVLSDETGSGGGFVRATGPTIDSPILSTKVNLPRVTAFPGTPSVGDTVIVTDDSAAGACDSAAGSATSLCQWNGSAWVAIGDGNSGSGAPTNATYIVQTANGTLSNEQALGSLASGILKNTTTTGVLSIAVAGTDYVAGTPGTTANAVPRASGTGGTTLKASGVTIDDSDVLTAPGGLIAGTSGIGKATLLEGTAPAAPGTAGQHTIYFDSTSHYLSSIVNGGSAVSYFSTLGGQVNALTAKSTPTTSDLLMIEDAAASNAKKKSTVDQVLAANDARSKTLTNTGLDCGGTGNNCTIKQEFYTEVAGCNNATAGPVWNLPTSNAATPTCDTGSNIFSAFLAFADAANQSYHGSFRLPTGYSGGIDWLFRYKMDAGTSGAIGWCVQLVRLPTGAAGDPALPALASGNCVSSTIPGTAGYEGEATISNVTCTSCVAGDRVFFRVSRDGSGTAVTDSATGVGRLVLSGRAYAVVY